MAQSTHHSESLLLVCYWLLYNITIQVNLKGEKKEDGSFKYFFGHLGTFWDILSLWGDIRTLQGHFRTLLETALDFLVPSWYHYGTFWSPLELLEPLGGYLLDILECFGTFWDFLSPFRGHSGLSRDILGPYGEQFWTFSNVLGLFVPF